MKYIYPCLFVVLLICIQILCIGESSEIGTSKFADFDQDSDLVKQIKLLMQFNPDSRLESILVKDQIALTIIRTIPDDLTYPNSYDGSFDNYSAYSINLKAGTKTSIPWKGYNYKLLGESRLSNSHQPDIIIKYDHCVECCANTYIGAFYFNEQSQLWDIRKWSDKVDQIIVNISMFDEPWTGEFIYAIEDFNKDKYDEIVFWLHEQNPDTNEINEYINMYQVIEGKGKEIKITDKEEQNKIKQMLCQSKAAIRSGQNSSACKPVLKQ